MKSQKQNVRIVVYRPIKNMNGVRRIPTSGGYRIIKKKLPS